MTIPRILQALILMVLIPAAYAVVEASGPHGQGSDTIGRNTVPSSLSVVAHGNATVIGAGSESNPPIVTPEPPISIEPVRNQSMTASVSIKAAVDSRNESAVITFDITGSSLTIGSKTYAVVNGTGIFNQRSLVVVLHAAVTSSGTSSMLILIGHADSALSSNGSVGVMFGSPESKLAGKFFLSLKGTLTLS